METSENMIGDTMKIDRDHLFAFAHGIRMTIEAQGLPFNNDTMTPILERMDSILTDCKNSFVRGNDKIKDWDQFRHLRELEKQLCAEYIKEMIVSETKNEPETS